MARRVFKHSFNRASRVDHLIHITSPLDVINHAGLHKTVVYFELPQLVSGDYKPLCHAYWHMPSITGNYLYFALGSDVQLKLSVYPHPKPPTAVVFILLVVIFQVDWVIIHQDSSQNV